MRRRLVSAILLLGIGLIAAPAVFQMFSRAPKGGEMINEFRPFMEASKVEQFQDYMAQIDSAHSETSEKLPAFASDNAGMDGETFDTEFPSTAAFNDQWPAIFKDMNDGMLVTMEEMVDNFAAVDALPPFPLFPFFFVAPGIMISLLAWSALQADKKGTSTRSRLKLLALLGIGLIAAPAIFQMFGRAPKGAEMINEFRSLMTEEKLARVQGYFLVLGAAEGELRNSVEPALGLSGSQLGSDFPALAGFHLDWGKISGDMAPMIGAMADNIDNYEAVDALPPFTLFPWFFVIPGVMVAALALAASARGPGLSGKEAFAAALPPPADATGAFFAGLKAKAEGNRASRAQSTEDVPPRQESETR